MELFLREIVVFFILFICYFWGGCSAVDCGGRQVSSTIVVDQSNSSNFQTVQAAIDSINANNNQWVKILIKAGTYVGKVQIPPEKPCIYLKGEGKGVTTITYSDDTRTDISATFSSFPNNTVASDITFKNSFAIEPDGERIPALAARVYGDKSAFFNCSFVGFQDTLWDVEGRHYFKNCHIEGAVDFIFGNGQSYYENCLLNVTASGAITAQARASESDPSGFVFKGGYVIGNGDTILGRAYGRCSRVIFYQTKLGPVIDPQGWGAWNYANQESCISYSEVACTGQGANTSNRVPWVKQLSPYDFNKQFSIPVFIDYDGWLSNLPFQ